MSAEDGVSPKKATSRSPTARRLTRAEFARALRTGLGRARLDARKALAALRT